ncbi:uncharacterized protein BXIN_1344 [Babesia sp. Xinjiang]|uniref:uncharacterized protein n=1 Tax=Babesia sp. Xinjiang TaxID=462227 RepID=UPI000A25C535|nr:uncharacterized protein BXIN_1344 [Babesia sp. Xinjiang]ORM39898.1 hypothetical protein BXIN_1344 [Babesia sp. Xinjiang]
MDRTADFKRRVIHFMRVSPPIPTEDRTTTSEHYAVDRFSLISANVFSQLQTLSKLVEPYTVVIPTGASRDLVGGEVDIPLAANPICFIQNKRRLFEQTDIKDIVNDIRVAGDLVKQMSNSIEEELKRSKNKTISRQLQEHRIGVIACLQHKLKTVQTDVEEYERYRLKVETNLNVALRVMTENRVKEYRMDQSQHDNAEKHIISEDYLNLFVKDNGGVNTARKTDAISRSNCGILSPAASPQIGATDASAIISARSRQMAMLPDSRFAAQLDYMDAPSEQDLQMLEMQHKALVQRVNESVQAAEISTIDGVQRRLSEISSMFEQFSGTLAVQLDMFECINANVMESLSNIETTENSLKKTDNEGMSFLQLMMCYSFVGTAIFLLLVDYLKSGRGSYMF